MENASKALLMAGGILTTLIIIGLLLLTFNRIGAYRQANSDSQKTTRIADFNNEFLKYIEDGKIEGSDLITLANKIIDFNKKNGTLNYINYDFKMKLTVGNIANFRSRYGYTNRAQAFFSENQYTIEDKSSNSHSTKKESQLEDNINLFNGVDKGILKRLSGAYNPDKSDIDNKKAIKDVYEDWDEINPTYKLIKNYKEYSEFMASRFKLINVTYNEGQLQSLSFNFDSI